MKILIADDNAHIRYLLFVIVKSYFDEIFECENGFDAVKAFEKNKPDWVLMDAEMPYINGFAATKEITKNCPQAMIIILCEEIDDSSRRIAKTVGATALANKDNLLQIRSIIAPKQNK